MRSVSVRVHVQIDGRDRVDREIEQCVCSLMDKTRHMEELNKKLVAKINELEAAKATPDTDDPSFVPLTAAVTP